jgi:hypothetical protein
MKGFVVIILSLFSLSINAQVDSLLLSREKQLSAYLDNLRNSKSDLDKETANQTFKNYLQETIAMKGAIDYPFSMLRTVGTIKSPDNQFRFFNWNVEQEDETHKYYCFILKFDGRKKNWKTIELVDNSMMVAPQPEDVLDETMWYGALYYKIIPVEKSNKTYYTLLGYDANNNLSHTKLIDILSFSGNHIKLGSPIFKNKDQVLKRMFFEHSKKCIMTLNYDEARSRIIFDHLSPESQSMEGFREFYVPDMSYDAFIFVNNKWILEEDVIGINSKSSVKNKSVVRLDIDKEGQLVRHKENGKWIDPSNPNVPAGENIHTPALPEGQILEVPKEKKSKKEESEFPPVRKRNKKHKSGITSN